MTKYGKMISDVVLASSDHPTAEQIYQQIREQGTHISRATVYNNLNALVDSGRLSRLTLEGSPDRYDKPEHHDHLVCAGCGRLTDLHLPDLTEIIEKETGTSILSYSIRVNYLCSQCREKLEENEQAE